MAETTTLQERIDAPVQVVDRPRRIAGQVMAALPWLLALAALVTVWWRTGVPWSDTAGYLSYWSLALVLPGTLVHRALRGSRGNLPEDLGYGAAVGLLLELAAWAATAAAGTQQLLRWWPVPVVALFLGVPRLRRHWRIPDPRPLPLAWHWATSAVLIVIIGWAAIRWRGLPLPPVTHAYYQDLLYHLSLVQELTRTMPFELPHLAGEPLRYHYLSDAHMASASMISGSAPAVVLLRLWLVPVAATAALVTAGLGRALAGPWWVGPTIAGVAYVGLPVTIGSVMTSGSSPLSFGSPSQTYVLPLLVLLAGLCVDAVRGQALGPSWLLVPALGLACAGAKSSALPPLIAGLFLAGLVAGARQRRLPSQALAALGSLLVALAVGYLLFAGGGASSLKLQAFALLRYMAPYRNTLGVDDGMQATGLVLPGLATADLASWLFALSLLIWWLITQAPRFVGMGILASREVRTDPAAWLLVGTVIAGTAGAWLFYHPSASQIYFFLPVIPFGVLLSGWLLATARPPWPVLVAAGALGVIVYLTVPPLPSAGTADAWLDVFAESMARTVAFVAAAAALAVLVAALVRRWRGRSADGGRGWIVGAAVAGVTAALLAASAAPGVKGIAASAIKERPPVSSVATPYLVTADEMRAALWLDANAAANDVVATNVHCRPVKTTPRCDARAFWVTGLGGHRAVVESWGYTDESLAAQGRNGLPYVRQPPPDQDTYALNERVFVAPTETDLAQLRREYGVRWLFADSRAGAVSPDLAALARVRLVSGSVTIYELS